MNAREAILSAARSASLPRVELPTTDTSREAPAADDLIRAFKTAARATGAEVLTGDRGDLARFIRKVAPHATRVISAFREIPSTLSEDAGTSDLAHLEVFVCEAVLGVAENGAVWLPRSRLGPRAAAFLAEHVVVVLERATLVADLHEAYRQIDAAAESFGVFVAGPSKTADIEQSLVIGAHGPKRLTVLLC